MKEIILSKTFLKRYKEIIRLGNNIEKRVVERINLFLQDRMNPILRDHQLQGRKSNYRSFSIKGDLRIIYSEDNNYYYFEDIGTHNQVYE